MASKVPDGFEPLTEGRATVLFDKNRGVFYNKVQEFNRDISILVIKMFDERRKMEFSAFEEKRRAKQAKRDAFLQKKTEEEKAKSSDESSENLSPTDTAPAAPTPAPAAAAVEAPPAPGLRIFEALSATGLRSIRYFNEIPGIDKIIVNDLDPNAVASIKRNVEHNKLDTAKVVPNQGDANAVMYGSMAAKTPKFHVIDLDPYGSASIFLDAAVQGVEEGGLLCITCTDKAVLCGNNSETCYSKYGCMPLRGPHCHEQAVRIVLSATQRAANRHKKYIVPLVSLSIDFYVRVFVRVYSSAAQVKRCANKQAHVFQCVGCAAFHVSPVGTLVEKGNSIKFGVGRVPDIGSNCQSCGGRFAVGGPIYSSTLHDRSFVRECLAHVKANQRLFKTAPRIMGTLTLCDEELDVPLLYDLSLMARTLKARTPKTNDIKSAIVNAGYKVSQAHALSKGVKTDAPPNVLWDIFRCYVKLNPTKVKADTPGGRILAKEPTLKADFKFNKAVLSSSMVDHVPKFLPNPEAYWGPGSRAKATKDGAASSSSSSSPSSSSPSSSSSSSSSDAARAVGLGEKRTMHEAMHIKARENQGKRRKKAAANKAGTPSRSVEGARQATEAAVETK